MDDSYQFIKQLISLPGLSGFETPIRDVIAEKWRPLTDKLVVSKLGNLYGFRQAAEANRPTLLLGTHMDAIGLMVTSVEGEFLHITSVGGVDPRILPGQNVMVHGRRDLPGVAVLWPDRLLAKDHQHKAPIYKRILIDTGLTAEELAGLVEVGDLVSFNTQPTELSGETLSGHSLDNRASVAALTQTLQELQGLALPWNVVAVATTCEEVNFAGSITSAFELEPDMSVAIDVTFAKGPGSTDYRTFDLGKGPTIGTGPNIHPYLVKQFKKLAESMEIPYAIETMPTSSGTDGMAFQISRSGLPNMVIGIPLRYMHTPVEVISAKDLDYTARLISGFVKSLDETTLSEAEKEMLL